MIKTALRGYLCEHYNGQKTRVFKHAMSAHIASWFLGSGWYVRQVKDLAFIIN